MSIPTAYPVTLVDQDGHQYQVFDAAGYVNAVYSLGHKPVPSKAAAPPAPAPAPASPRPSVTAEAMTTKSEAPKLDSSSKGA